MVHSPNVKPRVLISALLQITIDTDETTDRLNAPMVPSWNRSLSLIFSDINYSFLDPDLTLYSYENHGSNSNRNQNLTKLLKLNRDSYLIPMFS